jgi:hypothetical protein
MKPTNPMITDPALKILMASYARLGEAMPASKLSKDKKAAPSSPTARQPQGDVASGLR